MIIHDLVYFVSIVALRQLVTSQKRKPNQTTTMLMIFKHFKGLDSLYEKAESRVVKGSCVFFEINNRRHVSQQEK